MRISPAGYRAVILMVFASGSVFFAVSNGWGNVSASVAAAMDAGSDPAAMIFPQCRWRGQQDSSTADECLRDRHGCDHLVFFGERTSPGTDD